MDARMGRSAERLDVVVQYPDELITVLEIGVLTFNEIGLRERGDNSLGHSGVHGGMVSLRIPADVGLPVLGPRMFCIDSPLDIDATASLKPYNRRMVRRGRKENPAAGTPVFSPP